MLFNSLDYAFFLPLSVFLYWGLPAGRARLFWIGACSLFFYGAWNLAYLPVILLVVVTAWGGGLWLHAWRHWRGHGLRRAVVALLVLLPLFFFKYWDWVAENIESLAVLVGLTAAHLPRVALALPVGISFHTFQALAYVIDVGRGRGPNSTPERSLWRFTTFETFFPQLVAGPILRPHHLLPLLQSLPLLQPGQAAAGVFRFLQGLAKKLLIADVLSEGIVKPVFLDPERFTALELMVALYAFTAQIYCDFSGYTDMAIGSARLFGIEFPENFRSPYKAITVAGFWRRWHMSLSDWVRDYIYYPLGGTRAGDLRTYVNLMLTMVIIGVWHGASWNFVIYGFLQGYMVCMNRAERLLLGYDPEEGARGWGRVWRWLLTFHFVVLARILFRAPDLSVAGTYARGLLHWELLLPRFSLTSLGALLLALVLHSLPDDWDEKAQGWFVRQHPALWALLALCIVAGALLLGTGDSLAFVYYQF